MSPDPSAPETPERDEDAAPEDATTEPQADASAGPTDGDERSDDAKSDDAPEPAKRVEDPRDRRIRELTGIIEEKDELLREYIRAHKQAQAQWESLV